VFVSSPPRPHVAKNGRPTTVAPTEENLRECQHHGLTVHYLRPDNHGWRCRRCIGEAVTRRKQRVRRILIEEAGGRCAVCGYDRCIINLHFHHVDPSTKSFLMSSAIGRAIAKFREEAKKCVLVCANCHGEIEAGLVESPPAQARYRGPSASA
jgi:hypothetical protein